MFPQYWGKEYFVHYSAIPYLKVLQFKIRKNVKQYQALLLLLIIKE